MKTMFEDASLCWRQDAGQTTPPECAVLYTCQGIVNRLIGYSMRNPVSGGSTEEAAI